MALKSAIQNKILVCMFLCYLNLSSFVCLLWEKLLIHCIPKNCMPFISQTLFENESPSKRILRPDLKGEKLCGYILLFPLKRSRGILQKCSMTFYGRRKRKECRNVDWLWRMAQQGNSCPCSWNVCVPDLTIALFRKVNKIPFESCMTCGVDEFSRSCQFHNYNLQGCQRWL